jgi:hypothetical protein
VALIDKYLQQQEQQERHKGHDSVSTMTTTGMRTISASCLKIADVFTEQSKEYYKQENTSEYAEAIQQIATERLHILIAADRKAVTTSLILNCEKELLLRFRFELDLPTAHWFLRCFLTCSGFAATGRVSRTASFICDLTLIDHSLASYPPSLRAQCSFLLAGFIQQQMTSKRQKACSGASDIDVRGLALTADSNEISLPLLEHWDSDVRNILCQKNTAMTATLCLQAVVHVLVVMRREWKAAKLTAVDAKYSSFVNTLVYPDAFPVSKLVKYILPDSQQGILPE